MRFDVITLFPELFAPHLDARRHAARLRVRARSRCSCGRCATSPRTATAASTTARTAAGRAWCCWPSRCSARWPRCAPQRADAVRRAGGALHARRAAASTRRWCASSPPAPGAVLLCGRYEGVDQRFIDRHVDARAQPGRLRAVRRRTAGAGAARRGGAAAAGRARRRRRTSRTAFPTACSTARTTAGPSCWPAATAPCRCRRCCCRATMPRSRAGAASARWS